MRVDRLGEAGLIRLISSTITKRGRVKVGIGDDACVLRDGTVMTTDAYAEGVHFSLDYMSWREVGQRSACAAISDVVAMAGQPEVVLVSLALPRETEAGSVRELYGGIDRVCQEMGCEVAGGDIIALDRVVLALTATGRARRPRLRSGGRPGDGLYVTGSLGAAEAGRMVLAEQGRGQRAEGKGQNGGRRVPTWAKELVERHLLPMPRLQVARAIAPRINGLIDTSDGLATDAGHLAEMSRVRVVIEAEQVPILGPTVRFCCSTGRDPVDFAVAAGEDYELLFTTRRTMPSSVRGVPLTRIGRLERGQGVLLERGGVARPLAARGYDHLASDT